MAIVQKQMIGQCITNQGLRFHSGLGIAYVPQDKLRRAFDGIQAALAGHLLLREYHSLLGLLQSLLFVVGLRKSATFGLWSPFAAATFNPEERMVPTADISERLQFWSRRLAECSGASFEAGVDRNGGPELQRLPPGARVVYVFRSDASKEGAAMPGLGGCLGGQGWRYPDGAGLNTEELALPIAVTEFAAFYGQVATFGDGVPDGALVLAEVDALATADALTTESAKQPLMQLIYHELERLPQFVKLRERMVISHVFGDANVMADAFSRGEFDTARRLASQMGMAYGVTSSAKALRALMRRLVARARPPPSEGFQPYRESYEHASASTSLASRPTLGAERRTRDVNVMFPLTGWLLQRARLFFCLSDARLAAALSRTCRAGRVLLGVRSPIGLAVRSQRLKKGDALPALDARQLRFESSVRAALGPH